MLPPAAKSLVASLYQRVDEEDRRRLTSIGNAVELGTRIFAALLRIEDLLAELVEQGRTDSADPVRRGPGRPPKAG